MRPSGSTDELERLRHVYYNNGSNPLSYHDGTVFTWVNGRRLATAVNTDSGLNVSYTYDADGLRLSKTVSGVVHKYVWQDGRLISEQFGNNTLEFFYDDVGRPFSVKVNGGTYFYITNLQGDVTAICNASGTILAAYNYDAYGKITSMTDNSLTRVNPLRYRGYYYDTETGFYYLKGRYYDPNICRFINADTFVSTGQGFTGCNMFAYCNDNPVNFSDSTGIMAVCCADDLIGDVENGTDTDERTTSWVESFRDILVEAKEREIPGTAVLGIDYSLGFGAENSGNIGIGFDNNGNIGLVVSENFGAGMPDASITAFLSISNAPSINELGGNSLSVGGSGGEVGVLDIETTIMPYGKSFAVAGTIQIGFGVGIPIEIHSIYGVTKVVSVNIYDLLIRGCDHVLR